MTRIIGGFAGGRRIHTPAGDSTRPTADRVREALFSSLESQLGSLAGLTFLDLYAGSGAVGLEAVSRGAASATFIEVDKRTADTVRCNAAALGMDRTTVLAARVESVVRTPPDGPRFDVVFADPPYGLDNSRVVDVLTSLLDQQWLEAGAVVITERPTRVPEPAWPDGLDPVKSKRYGDTVLWYVALARPPAPEREE